MLKREFIERVREMKSPVLDEFNPGGGLLQTQWGIMDTALDARVWNRDWFHTPMIKLSRRQWYIDRYLTPYYARVEKARKKYNRWFREAIGTEGEK